MSEQARGKVEFGIGMGMDLQFAIGTCKWGVMKWQDAENVDTATRLLYPHRYGKPEVIEGISNKIVGVGRSVWLKSLSGEGPPTAFNNANSFLGVGDSSTAPANADTGLAAVTNKFFQAMDATYPTAEAGAYSIRYFSTFAAGSAQFAWNEACLASGNNPPTTGIMLGRVTPSGGFGTKGAVAWTLYADVSLTSSN